MSIQEVVVQPREGRGKEDSKRLRRKGLIPSVVYGYGEESRAIVVEPKVINKLIRSEKGMNSVLNLRLHDTQETRHVMIKAVDRHPVTDRLLHVDFLRIDMDKKIIATIPIAVVGIPAGVKLGGILTTVRHEVEIECLPKNLPGTISIDVTNLELDEAFRVKDLPELDGVVYQAEPQLVIAVVHEPEREAVEEEEEVEEVVEEETEEPADE